MVLNNEILKIENLFVEYEIFSRTAKTPWGKISHFEALKGIEMNVQSGEIIAILGKNGSGKSTLIRAIAGLLKPSNGKIMTRGRVITLAGVDPGFLPLLTGRQNVRELAKAYGIKDGDIDAFSESVEEFADIGEAYDRNFGTYSTGMRGKVGFGFITTLKPEILLIDETLGVGDIEFREKASVRMKEFIREAGTVMISTHSLGMAKELCNRGIVVDDGKIVFDGDIEEAIGNYIAKE